MKKRIIRYLSIFIISAIICFFVHATGIYIIEKKEKSHKKEWLKRKSINGIIGANLYLIEYENYNYITYDFDLILGECFFKNNKIKNLEIEDSISKKPGEFILEIYRKDKNGQYQYIGTSK